MCEIFKNSIFRESLTAIGTISMAIATFVVVLINSVVVLINSKEKKARIKREICEKIINPLKEDLDRIIKDLQDKCSVKAFNAWDNIKQKEGYLLSSPLFEKIGQHLNDFHKELVSDLKLSREYNALNDLVRAKAKEALKSKGIDKKIRLSQTLYWAFIGVPHDFSFFRLLIKNRTGIGEEIKEEEDKQGKDSAEEKFFVNGEQQFKDKKTDEKRKIFNDVYSTILEGIKGNKESKDYIEKCQALRDKAYKLKNELNNFTK